MSKRQREGDPPREGMRQARSSGPSGPNWPQMLTLLGLAAVLVVTGLNYRETRRISGELKQQIDSQLAGIDSKVQQLTAKLDQASQRRGGPDPDRVYPIKTNGSPAKGPAAAPIVIAEFSDFQ